MKLIKLLVISLLFCFLFPLSSSANSIDEAIAAIEMRNFKTAVKLLTPLAENNNLQAKTILGTLYFKGEGTERDIKKGLSLITDAAKQGNTNAKAIALALNKELAQLENTSAMHNVGYMCLKGWGGKQDPNMCVEFLERAAQNGNMTSVKILVKIFSEGRYGVAADEEKASYWKNLAKN